MIGRPMLRYKVLNSTAAEWFGRPVHDVNEGDLWRWNAIRRAAAMDYSGVDGL